MSKTSGHFWGSQTYRQNYTQFFQSYANIAFPLNMLMKKDVIWHRGLLWHRAFETLKTTLCTEPLMIYPNPSPPYTVVLNASGNVPGGALMQDQCCELILWLQNQCSPRRSSSNTNVMHCSNTMYIEAHLQYQISKPP